MDSRLLCALVLVLAMSCEQSPRLGQDTALPDAAQASPDRSLESRGCPSSFGYRDPIFPERNGFLALPLARDGFPGELAFEFDFGSDSTFRVVVDSAGNVSRQTQRNDVPVKSALVGHIEQGVLDRMLSLRQAAAAAPMRSFFVADCPDSRGGNEVRVHGLDPPRVSPLVLAIGTLTPERRVSPEADVLIRWMLAIFTKAVMVPPFQELPSSETIE